MKSLKSFLREEEGISFVEGGMIVLGVVLVILSIVLAFIYKPMPLVK